MRTESKQFYVNNSLSQSKTADFPFIILLPQQLSSAVATSKTLSLTWKRSELTLKIKRQI